MIRRVYRTRKASVLAIGIIAVGLSIYIHGAEAATRRAEKPNIVFIFADDWGWGDLGCHGHPWLKTPNIDRLASEGTEFYQFTVASGVCSPSRAAVMAGHFPARHGIHGHFATVESHVKRGMPDWLDPEVVLLPRLLQEAGYATAHFGKWHLTNIMVPDAPLPSEYGYDTTGGHRGRKRSLLQGGIGVPFIAKWPGRIAAGKIDETTPITAVDLLPTFCDVADVELPKGYVPDGVSQLPALLGTAGLQRTKPVFWQWRTASNRGDNWPTLAVREGSWKLLLGKEASRVELFRFPSDRVEKTNLQEGYPNEVRRLIALIDAWKETLPAEPNEDCFSEQRGQ